MAKRATGSKRQLHNPAAVSAAIGGLADGIAAMADGHASFAIVGVRTRGLTLARRLHALLAPRLPQLAPLGALDITLYRDDLSTLGPQPVVGRSELPFALDGTTIALVDDVIYTGRTARAAIDALIAFGRPAAIRFAVLVDRGHREYPIQPDITAYRIETLRSQVVEVNLSENDGADSIDLVELVEL